MLTKLNTLSFLFVVILVTMYSSYSQQHNTELIIHGLDVGITGARAYLLESPRGMVLVDAGFSGHEKVVLKKMKKIGRTDLKLIFLTHAHFDHVGSALQLRKITGAPIGIHKHDSAILAQGNTPLWNTRAWGTFSRTVLFPLALKIWKPEGIVADVLFEDGDSLDNYGIYAKVLHTPGHTPGACCLIVNDSIALVGDLIASMPTMYVQKYYAHNWQHLAESFYKLKARAPARVYCGHGRKVLQQKHLAKLEPVKE